MSKPETTTERHLTRAEQRIMDGAMRRTVKQPDTERLRAAETELVRLRQFVQWVADHSNDPAVVQEARSHGAE